VIRYLLIALGGAIGAVTRVALSGVMSFSIFHVPLSIMLVNIIGCFVMGVLSEVLTVFGHISIDARYFLVQGLLGGFTTFSAFSLEFANLFEKGLYLASLVYVVLSIVLSLGFFFIGLKSIRTLFG